VFSVVVLAPSTITLKTAKMMDTQEIRIGRPRDLLSDHTCADFKRTPIALDESQYHSSDPSFLSKAHTIVTMQTLPLNNGCCLTGGGRVCVCVGGGGTVHRPSRHSHFNHCWDRRQVGMVPQIPDGIMSDKRTSHVFQRQADL
jgi:hypothetical protein